MARFIHSPVVKDESITAATTTTYDLPVNPLSFLLFTLKFLNVSVMATLANAIATISKVEVLFKGSAVISLSGADLYANTCFNLGHEPLQNNVLITDNAVRSLCLPIMFGRLPYSPLECFPASQRGSLQLQVTWAATFTNLDNVVLQVESVELPEATPQRFIKQTTLTKTPAATGDTDIELPIGNPITSLTIFGTTIPTGSTATITVDQLKLLADNTELYYSLANYESLVGLNSIFFNPQIAWNSHVHVENTAATYTQNATTAAQQPDDSDISQYLYLPFDIYDQGEYILQTEGLASLILRITAGDTNVIRVIPNELIIVK